MLKIVRSGFSGGARDAFCAEIKGLTEQGKRACLIVPEQQTVLAEGLMSGILPPSSALTFEVTNFTRLANTTFRSLGGLSGDYCDSVKKALIMWRTLTELAPLLTMTSGRKEINAGLVNNALSAVAEMQNLSILPNDLSESADNEKIKSDGRLSGKLSDLSKIYTLYKKLLSERYADTGDDAAAMIEKLLSHPDFFADTHIFIEGFTSFTEPQYRLIGILSARTSVSLALTLPKGREEAFEFSEVAECQRRLTSTARKYGADIRLAREEGNGAKRPEGLSEICSYLWSTITPNENISLQSKDILRIFEAKTPYEECSFVCEDIQRRVMEGASYSDFAIITRSSDSFSGILDIALEGAGVPSFTSHRKDVQEFEAIKLIYTAYSVARGFAREDVITYAKCALSGITRDMCDEFESYVNTWQINGRRFTDGEVWNMNPLGYTVRRNPDTDEKLLRIHSTREKIISPLSRFEGRARTAKTVREQATALLDFLLEIEMEDALKRRAKLLDSMGESALATENRALWQMICNALDTAVTVLGDSPADADTFLSQLKVIFSATDIGRIPAFSDSVTVGSADMLRLYEKKHIYLIGVNAGAFPASISDGSYFSERDRRTLSECGLAIKPELEIKGARELYIFSRAFSYATESVTLSYSASNTRMKSIEPSEVIGRICTLGGIKPISIASLGTLSRIFTPAAALERMGELSDDYSDVREALIESGHADSVAVCEGDITNSAAALGRDIVSGLTGRTMSLSQTKIDSFVNCPFAYFCKHTVKLKQDERAEFDARGIGNFVHAILENFFKALAVEGKSSGDLDKGEREKLTRAAAEKYIKELGEDIVGASVRTKIKIDRLCRAARPVVDGLCDEFSASKFQPRYFELSISNSDDSPAPVSLKNQNGRVDIYGTIDRVDAYQRGDDVYLRVIDYKTGHKSFSPDDMAEGSNLQMFLYLKSLVESDNKRFHRDLGLGESGRIVPAGVIYVKTTVGDVRIDTPDDNAAEEAVKSAQGREGMILNDPDVISAMDVRYTPVFDARYPDKITKTKEKYLYTEEEWGEIMQTVESSVMRVADAIRDGEMPATPKWLKSGKSSCEYCEFKPICRKVEKK